jgi:predicted lipid-binding transport protein (Tim44 family)
MSPRFRQLSKAASWVVVALAALAVLTTSADARVGGGGSFGSRGGRTFATPPTTNTAPRAASPIEKSLTQPNTNPATGFASRFGGWRSILLGSLIGAALASLLGAGVLASVLGFVLQLALIAGIVWLVMAYLARTRAAPALAGGLARTAYRPRPEAASSPRSGPPVSPCGSAVTLVQDDFDTFERLLGDIQLAYGRGDRQRLAACLTGEMLSHIEEELDANARRGLRNEIRDPKLLQGDLSETWREPSGEYATVAMRYALTDAMIETASGRVVSGSTTQPEEVTEVWTFRRPRGGTTRDWKLSAIQQVGRQLPLAS